jgi:hypothetical protein
MFRRKAISIGIPALLLTGIAGQIVTTSKLTGDTFNAQFSSFTPEGSAFAAIFPSLAHGGKQVYFIFWQSCTFHPDPSHSLCMEVNGQIPKPEFFPNQTQSLTLNLDVSSIVNGFAFGVDCTTGTCVSFPVTSLPLNGTFSVFTGPGSSTEKTTGQMTSQFNGGQFGPSTSMTLSGDRLQFSANFVGTIGQIALTAPPFGANGTLNILRGQQTITQVYPTTP